MATQKTTSVTQIMQTISTTIMTNTKQLTIGMVVVVLCIGIAFMYRLWSVHRDEMAQRTLGPLMEVYAASMHEKEPQWAEIAKKCDEGYKNHSRSHLAPYYLGYEAQALLEQDKKSEALAVLETVINQLSDSPLTLLYKTMSALIKLDMPEADMQKTGKNELDALAHNKKNQFRDTALFYLGRYYWINNEISLARDVWQQLVDEQRDEKIAPSPWLDEAKEYLKLTIA